MNTKNNATVTDRSLHQEWWVSLPAGEKEFIRTLMGMIKGAKRSEFHDVANAARKWESAIGYFMKLRLKRVRRQKSGVRTDVLREAHGTAREARALPVTACRSVLRSQRGVSPNQD